MICIKLIFVVAILIQQVFGGPQGGAPPPGIPGQQGPDIGTSNGGGGPPPPGPPPQDGGINPGGALPPPPPPAGAQRGLPLEKGLSNDGYVCICKSTATAGEFDCNCQPNLASAVVNPGGNAAPNGGQGQGPVASPNLRPQPGQDGNNPNPAQLPGQDGNNPNPGAGPAPVQPPATQAPATQPPAPATPPPVANTGDENFGDTTTWVMCVKDGTGWTSKPDWAWLYIDGKSAIVKGKWVNYQCSYGRVDAFLVRQSSYNNAIAGCKARGYPVAQPADGLHSGWFTFQVDNGIQEYYRQNWLSYTRTSPAALNSC